MPRPLSLHISCWKHHYHSYLCPGNNEHPTAVSPESQPGLGAEREPVLPLPAPVLAQRLETGRGRLPPRGQRDGRRTEAAAHQEISLP